MSFACTARGRSVVARNCPLPGTFGTYQAVERRRDVPTSFGTLVIRWRSLLTVEWPVNPQNAAPAAANRRWRAPGRAQVALTAANIALVTHIQPLDKPRRKYRQAKHRVLTRAICRIHRRVVDRSLDQSNTISLRYGISPSRAQIAKRRCSGNRVRATTTKRQGPRRQRSRNAPDRARPKPRIQVVRGPFQPSGATRSRAAPERCTKGKICACG